MKQYLLILLILMLPFISAADWNYSKDVTVTVPVHVIVSIDNNMVTIETSAGTKVYSTLANTDDYIEVESIVAIDQSYCPMVNEVVDPLLIAVEGCITDLNESNNVLEALSREMIDRLDTEIEELTVSCDVNGLKNTIEEKNQSAIDQLNNSILQFITENKEYLENTLLPSKDDFDILNTEKSKLEAMVVEFEALVNNLQKDIEVKQSNVSFVEMQLEFLYLVIGGLGLIVLLLLVALGAIIVIHLKGKDRGLPGLN